MQLSQLTIGSYPCTISKLDIGSRYQPERGFLVLRDLFLGFIKLHILHHAGVAPVYGAWLLEELASHGYELSPGTLYPTLHNLENEGYLTVQEQVVEGRVRKYYSLTEAGRAALEQARAQAIELVREIGGETSGWQQGWKQ